MFSPLSGFSNREPPGSSFLPVGTGLFHPGGGVPQVFLYRLDEQDQEDRLPLSVIRRILRPCEGPRGRAPIPAAAQALPVRSKIPAVGCGHPRAEQTCAFPPWPRPPDRRWIPPAGQGRGVPPSVGGRLIGPVLDAAEVGDVAIAHRGQLVRRFGAAMAGMAVDQDLRLLLEGQGQVRLDVLVGQADGAGDVAGVVFLLGAHVQEDDLLAGVQAGLGGLRGEGQVRSVGLGADRGLHGHPGGVGLEDGHAETDDGGEEKEWSHRMPPVWEELGPGAVPKDAEESPADQGCAGVLGGRRPACVRCLALRRPAVPRFSSLFSGIALVYRKRREKSTVLGRSPAPPGKKAGTDSVCTGLPTGRGF